VYGFMYECSTRKKKDNYLNGHNCCWIETNDAWDEVTDNDSGVRRIGQIRVNNRKCFSFEIRGKVETPCIPAAVAVASFTYCVFEGSLLFSKCVFVCMCVCEYGYGFPYCDVIYEGWIKFMAITFLCSTRKNRGTVLCYVEYCCCFTFPCLGERRLAGVFNQAGVFHTV
jgi:hypothetical protein